ncbi:MAG: hypothetical protein HDT24_05640 [Ruminococcus sp.]|nr:hypothetical protein [Ruminococcus sp.]
MRNLLTEKQVLKKLDIPDFRHLTKGKVIDLASMLDRMDPEVAKKALEQFPEFAKAAKEILAEYKDTLDKGIASNNESVKAYYDVCNSIINSLQKELENESHSFDEKKYIMEQMKEIADKMDKKDTENKKWIFAMAALAGGVFLTAVAGLATALGGNTHVEEIDTDDDEEDT